MGSLLNTKSANFVILNSWNWVLVFLLSHAIQSYPRERYRICCNRSSTLVVGNTVCMWKSGPMQGFLVRVHSHCLLWIPSCHGVPATGAFFFITGFTPLMLHFLTALGADTVAACIHPASTALAWTRSFFSASRFSLPWHLSLLNILIHKNRYYEHNPESRRRQEKI